ncbi:Beta-galactosidase/beta-glucuronidase [Mucilaginibacter pineti]|uniref:Beta-galactosidase/beta-glucuronidase n=1 Tax=Mucilaginibacter pineti TaxID=1391627 RepID=A0A1G7D718_9SPHI|nr:discoidin domain-containing protein [Mucilaginibacter pineti]SDE47321.1 Beta-galactosidase/beta-glucuronidase [Mucilaginibacter pineti]
MLKNYIANFKFIATLLLTCIGSISFAQSNIVSLSSTGKQVWKVTPQADVVNPAEMNQPNYNTQNWVAAVVPGTVFASYVAAGLEKDPNYADNIYKVDRTKYNRSFWYRTEFNIPVNYTKKKIWLNFKGVNRKADIYLNGIKLGTLDGFMQRGNFDITDIASRKQKNVLTVLVFIPKQPLANIGSPNYVSSAGWDWMPYVPGLNSGITDKVYLTNTGDLTIQDPWIQTKLPTNARADLSVALEVKNNTTAGQQGYIKGVINPGNIEFSQKVFVDANGSTTVKMDKRYFSQLMIHSPKLWWPNGYGDPNLYDCKLSLTVGDQVSDVQHIKFGIKRYSYDTVGHVLHVAINGTPVFIKGGAWGMSEYLLRCRGDEYDTKIKLHREMNFNMIRNWIGSTTDEEFYDACDKYGIMVWDEFWLNANPNLPADLNAFNSNAIEKIKRFRNHPAIAVWCADNEGWPEPPLSGWLKEDLTTFDGGDRWYQPNSHAENLTGSGPWDNRDPRFYFTAYPTATGGNKGWGLRTELGTAVFTNFESFKRFIPKDKWWPRNEMWNQHFFGPLAFNAGPDNYDASVNAYGTAKDIEDYCRKAQFVNVEANKAMFEGWQDHIGEDASGIMTWMSQSAYPSMVWQTYDYYYDLTGAYYGAKKACEPLHIQWNPVDNAIKVINTTHADAGELTATAEIYNLDGKLVNHYSDSKTIDAPSNSATECFKLKLSESKLNLALNKPVFASSSTNGDPSAVNDGNNGTRWASRSNDDEWIYVDLGKEEVINGVGLNWEDAYPKTFKVQVSNDAKRWNDVYVTNEGRPGEQQISFVENTARYVRVQGVERGTYWGYSLWNFEVYQGDVASEGLSAVHFIKLKLTDKAGKLVSDNFYWRGNKRKDYSALSTLPKVDLKVSSKTVKSDGKYYITAQITNPSSSVAVAFGVRVQTINSATGEQILPAITSDNYFSLLKGETKTIKIEFNADALGKGTASLKVEPYNNMIVK